MYAKFKPVAETVTQGSKPLGMVQDPLIKAAKAAYRQSETHKIDQLLRERAKWSRRYTIASNKLAEVEKAIIYLCEDLAKRVDGGKDHNETQAH